jgi:hypothetical protein
VTGRLRGRDGEPRCQPPAAGALGVSESRTPPKNTADPPHHRTSGLFVHIGQALCQEEWCFSEAFARTGPRRGPKTRPKGLSFTVIPPTSMEAELAAQKALCTDAALAVRVFRGLPAPCPFWNACRCLAAQSCAHRSCECHGVFVLREWRSSRGVVCKRAHPPPLRAWLLGPCRKPATGTPSRKTKAGRGMW